MGKPFDLQHQPVFAWVTERDGMALAAIAPGSANAMHVGLGHIGQVVVKDMGNRLNINTARGNVGGDQNMHAAAPKGCQGTVALALVFVAMNRLGIDTLGPQRLLEPIGAMLGSGKDDCLIDRFGLKQAHQGLGLFALCGQEQGLLDFCNGLGRRGHRDLYRGSEKFLT